MFDAFTASWTEIREYVYPEVVSPSEPICWDDDAVVVECASINIVFVIDVRYIDGPGQFKVITHSDLKRWQIDKQDLITHVESDRSVVRVGRWEQVHGKGRVYQPPDFGMDWTYHLFCPDELSDLDIDGQPLVMVPDRDVILVTGLDDQLGIRTMMEAAKGLAPDPLTAPLTPLPLLFDGRAWQEAEVLPTVGKISLASRVAAFFRRNTS